MKCSAVDQLDCYHLEKNEECWACKAQDFKTVDSQVEGCTHYETGGEYALRIALQHMAEDADQHDKEFDEWRDRYTRYKAIGGIIILITYAVWVVWMFS